LQQLAEDKRARKFYQLNKELAMGFFIIRTKIEILVAQAGRLLIVFRTDTFINERHVIFTCIALELFLHPESEADSMI
jgi:hypothetical protein